MGNIKGRVAALPLAALMLLTAAGPVTAFAADQAKPNISAASYLVPVESTQAIVNGEMVLVETYKVPTSMDPNELIKDPFELRGYFFELNSIIKEDFDDAQTKDVTKEYSVAVNSGELADNIGMLPETLSYDEGNWTGTLYPVLGSVNIQVTDTATRSKTSSTTKTFDLGEFNDPTAIPATYNGMSRTSYDIQPSGYIDGSSIPSGYTATATYAKKSYYKVDTTWKMTATYSGVATYDELTHFQYTLTYKGDEIQDGQAIVDGELITIPKGYEVVDGQLVKTGFDFGSFFGNAGIVLLVLVLLGGLATGIVFAVLAGIKRGIFYSRKIVIESQDDNSGEYTLMQKVRVNPKNPAFTLDVLRAPSARHFKCSMSGGLAKKLRGTIINVSAGDQVVAKHRVEPFNDKERYVFAVSLEDVDSGPMDTFSL